jgi:hypothetical protein
MISVPHTYAEWIEIFDELKSKSNDTDVFNAMHQGTIEWQTGVAERFSKKLTDVINYRMNNASDKFSKDLNYAKGQENLIIQALLTLRKEMSFLSKAIRLPAIPEKDRNQYYQLVRDQADKMQQSLEDTAKKDRTGKMSSIVRNHKINVF